VAQTIVRAARDSDLYIVWSSIVDAPVAVGHRAEMVAYAANEWRLDPDAAEAAVVRADTNGSSDRVMRFGWWDDEHLLVMEGSPTDGWYHISRDRLVEYAEALLRDDDQAAVALLKCWQRHDEPTGS
jgi:hypothetical protein